MKKAKFFKMQLTDGTTLSAFTCSRCCLEKRKNNFIKFIAIRFSFLFSFFSLKHYLTTRTMFLVPFMNDIIVYLFYSSLSSPSHHTYRMYHIFVSCFNIDTIHMQCIHNYIRFNGALMSMKKIHKVALKFMLQ